MLEQASRCLNNLQVEYVDLLYLHAPDHSTPVEETLGAIQELYKGVVHCLKMILKLIVSQSSWEVQRVWIM